jgi:hypothetical protein
MRDQRCEVVGIAVYVIGGKRGWVVALAVATMVEEDALVRARQLIDVAGNAPKLAVTSSADV